MIVKLHAQNLAETDGSRWALACSMLERDKKHPEDVKKAELAQERLKDHFAEFGRAVDKIYEVSPILAANLYGHMVAMIDAALIIGAHDLFARNARREFQRPLIEPRREGGRKSGEKRREEAEQMWRPYAIEIAQEVLNEMPKISQMNLAGEISSPDRWKKKIYCPKSMLVPAISAWLRDGTLRRPNT